MNLRNSFIHLHPAAKLLITLTLFLIGAFLSDLIGLVFKSFVTTEYLGEELLTESMNISAMKILQIVSQLLIFLMPAYIIAFISTPDPLGFLKINTPRRNRDFLFAAILTFSSIAIINLLAAWNSELTLPDNMEKLEKLIRNMQDATDQIQERMLSVSSFGGLFFNLIVMAVFPAITEELFFRGIIQRLLKDWIRNPHVAIFITGIIFSFIHFQFYGFVPRVFMGVILGYLLYLTNNIWVPIFAHFLNNSIVVVSYFFYYKSDQSVHPDELGSTLDSPYLYVSLVLFVIVSVYFFQRKRKLSL